MARGVSKGHSSNPVLRKAASKPKAVKYHNGMGKTSAYGADRPGVTQRRRTDYGKKMRGY